MTTVLSRTATIAALAALATCAGAVFAQAPSQVCQKTLNGISVCDVAKDTAQLRPSTDTSAPAKPGEAMRYTEIYSKDNQVVLKGRLLFDRDTFTRNVTSVGKSLEQVRSDMDAAGRQSACAPESRPFIDAGGALRMSVAFPDGSAFLDSVYDRC
jgi:hypothetical protein